jgi:hypothetical protein
MQVWFILIYSILYLKWTKESFPVRSFLFYSILYIIIMS